MDFKKRKLKPEKFQEAMEWLNVIWVTEIGACPKKIQFRQFYSLKREPSTYEQYQGTAVDELFREIAKGSNIKRPEIYKKVLKTQWLIPENFAPRLYRNLPSYETRIKDFFENDRIGKVLYKGGFSLQAPLKCPLNKLGFHLDLSQEVIDRYEISGKVDFLATHQLLEVKSGSKPKGHDYRQAIVYQKLWKALKKSPMGYYLLYVGKNGPIRKSVDRRHWNFATAANKMEEEIESLLIQTISQREKLRVDPYYPFKEWTPKVEECQYCAYRKKCRSRVTKVKHGLKKLIWMRA